MKKNKQGFVLLYAILLTGAVLTVGVLLMNIIARQYIFSSVSQSSEAAYYYLATSGRECAFNFDQENLFASCNVNYADPFNPVTTCTESPDSQITVNCFGSQPILLSKDTSSGLLKYRTDLDHPVDVTIGSNDYSVDISITKNLNCMEQLLNGGSCSGSTLEEKNQTFIEVSGYSLPSNQADNPRRVKRTAAYVY